MHRVVGGDVTIAVVIVVAAVVIGDILHRR